MQKQLLSLIAIFICCATFAQTATLSPRTKWYLHELEKNGKKPVFSNNFVYKQDGSSQLFMSAVVKVNDEFSVSEFENLGVKTNTQAGKIRTVHIPVEKVEAFTQLRGMDYIELDEPVAMSLDSARKTTHVDSVHEGAEPLAMPYTGNGVVVGVVDVGFDYTHPTFFDTARQIYRIKRIWEEHKNGTPPNGFSYGKELTDSLQIQAEKTDDTLNCHGTHVAGIAAGCGRGSGTGSFLNNKYRGVAYESDLVLVGIMPDSAQWQNTGVSDVIDGMNYIYAYAESVGKPAVVNLSWGSPVGPRDGSSLFSQAVDAMTGAGKIFEVSAGNDGDVNLHLRKTFSATDTLLKTFVTFYDTLHTNTWLDLWGEAGNAVSAKVSLFNNGENASTGFVNLDNNVHEFALVASDGDTAFVTMTTSTAEFNGKPRIYFSVGSKTSDSIVLSVAAHSGTIDIWNGYVEKGSGYFGTLESFGYPWATAGNADYTTSDWVSTSSAISAGAYAARTSFRTIGGQSYGFTGYAERGGLVPFSSHGPTADARIVPTITAPGLAVISSLSSYDHDFLPNGAQYSTTTVSRTYDSINAKYFYYGQMSGTSMSGPMTSGIIALMLEANPTLTPTQVKNVLAQTAIVDTFTGALPAQGTTTWGHGKINAFQAVLAASALPAGLVDVNEKWLNCTIFPNPTSGKFTLEYTGTKNEHAVIEIYDLNGRKLVTDSWNTVPSTNRKTIDASAFAAGVYFVKLFSASGSWASKVVVE